MNDAKPARSMDGKVCLVTGATAGIGLVAALELARQGARVIGVGRSAERGAQAARQIREQVEDANVEFRTADLSSQADIRRFASDVIHSTPRLDVLLNNAGGIFIQRETTGDGLEMTFALNHLAYFLLTNLLLDLIKASSPARIVCVASAAHQGATIDFSDLQGLARYSFWKAYKQSKLANILFVRELARKLEGTGVTVNALHPGYVKTQIFRAEGGMGWLLRRSADVFAISPERGAETSVYLASSPDVARVTGQYFARSRPIAPSKQARDEGTSRRLWSVSSELTRLPTA